jgi:hypothetical protein
MNWLWNNKKSDDFYTSNDNPDYNILANKFTNLTHNFHLINNENQQIKEKNIELINELDKIKQENEKLKEDIKKLEENLVKYKFSLNSIFVKTLIKL